MTGSRFTRELGHRWSALTDRSLGRLDRAVGWGDGRGEDGASTVEFVVLLPLFLTMFMTSFEISMTLVRQVMLERAVDVAVRDIRLDLENNITQAALSREICERAIILPDCRHHIVVELTEVVNTTFDLPEVGTPCRNRLSGVTPPIQYLEERTGKIVLLRACVTFDPLLPGVELGVNTINGDDGSVQLFAATAFMVEQ